MPTYFNVYACARTRVLTMTCAHLHVYACACVRVSPQVMAEVERVRGIGRVSSLPHHGKSKESACESASVRRGKEALKDGCNVAAKEKEDEYEDEDEGHC